MADWDGAAPGYGSWWPTFERALRPILDEIVALAGVAPGHRVLDAGTGVGEPAATAARKAGPGGTVIAVDSSAEMLDAARARTAALGVDVTFLQGDAATMPLPGPFDAVLASYSLMFLPDLPAALRRFCAALRPGGSCVAS
ncbi:MAG: class I SAM-dependent methyltransferase, partial [Actinomycetes bacterium]